MARWGLGGWKQPPGFVQSTTTTQRPFIGVLAIGPLALM